MGRALALAMVVVVLVAPAASASHGELLARWHLDTSAADDSGHGLHGTLVNGAAFVAGGRFGGALDLGGPGDSQVDVADSTNLEAARLTVMAWVKSASGVGAHKYVVGKGAAGCSGSSYALSSGAGGGMVFSIVNGTTQYVSPAAGPGLWDGQWHAVAGTFDGATVRLWVDGAQVGSGTAAPVAVSYGLMFDDLRIGNHPASNFCSGGFTWPGEIDEVRVYNRVLDADELGHLQAPGHVAPPDLPPPPSNLAPPSIEGVEIAGLGLTARPGSWTRSPTRFEYQWMRCDGDGGACSEIAGASSEAYGLRADDVGRKLRVRVRAVNAGGTSAPAFSGATRTVAPAPPVEGNTPGGGSVLRDPPLPLTARLVVSPAPACSGMPVTFDGRTSSGPHPIVRYRFTYGQPLAHAFDREGDWRPTWGEQVVVSDGPAPTAAHVFRPNDVRPITIDDSDPRDIRAVQVAAWRTPATLALEVWDTTGRRHTSPEQRLTFLNETTPNVVTRACNPRDRLAPNVFAGAPLNAVGVSGGAVTATVPCRERTACRGLLVVTLASARAAQKTRRVVLASAQFTVPAGRSRSVRAKLTRRGRRLLARGRVRARVTLTGIGVDGIPRSKSRVLVLRRH